MKIVAASAEEIHEYGEGCSALDLEAAVCLGEWRRFLMDLTAHERKFGNFAHNPGLRTPFDNAVVSYDVFVSVGFERPVRFDDRGLVRVSVDLVAQLGWKAEKRRLLLIALRTRVVSSCVKGFGLMSNSH